MVTLTLSFSVFAQTKKPVSIQIAEYQELQETLKIAAKDAEQTAVRDEKGRITQVTIRALPESEKQTYQVEYGKHGLSAVTNTDGLRIQIEHDANGKIVGFIFPDGKKAVITWEQLNSDISLPSGIEIIRPDGNKMTKILFKNSLLDTSGECRRAINTAGAATLSATLICASHGISGECLAAGIAATVAIANAAVVCSES